MKSNIFLIVVVFFLLQSCKEDDDQAPFQLISVYVGSTELSLAGTTPDVPVEQSFVLNFSAAVDINSAGDAIKLTTSSGEVTVGFTFHNNNKSVSLVPAAVLNSNTSYTITISATLKGAEGQFFTPLEINFKTVTKPLTIQEVLIGDRLVEVGEIVQEVSPLTTIEVTFSEALNTESIAGKITVTGSGNPIFSVSMTNDNKTLQITNPSPMQGLRKYTLKIANTVQGINGELFSGYTQEFYTAKDDVLKFPLISDEDLLTLVQETTFKYFWNFAEPTSGMARERNSSGSLVTSGGSGFGLMAIVVGIERNFISRAEGLQRLDKILTFLESADRFHGAYSHWINGTNGDVIPFSPNDNGGDLVETAFLMQGLLTFRQYLNPTTEDELVSRINNIYKAVEWTWYTKDNEEVLYWHWSPDQGWIMNHPIRGHNETLITYVLAASSPTYPISAAVYHKGYARNGDIQNGNSYYNILLPLGEPYGGPLFFSHYSFLGLDPRNLQDNYANYWVQNQNHSRINHAYSIENPKNYVGYSDENWGLTASDNQNGYAAHSPTNDLGEITPTAALSSFPYTPVESMKAMKFFYYSLGDRLWGEYGFYDAFDLTAQWTADSYLAIDQGPIVIMIENYRTGLLWDLFMSAPEVQNGLTKLGFNY